MKGRVHRRRRPGIDIYSLRQPLGVCAGITPFNFPAMIPLLEARARDRLRQRLHPQALRARSGVPMRLAELLHRGGAAARHPQRRQRRQGSGRRPPRRSARSRRVGFVGSTPIAEYIYARGCAHGKRVQCFGGAKNHMIVMPDADMDQAVDALIGAGYGSAGERCMAISVAVPVGEADRATRWSKRLIPRVESLKVGPRPTSPPITARSSPRRRCEKVEAATSIVGVEEGAKLRRRRPRLQDAGLRERLLSSAAACSTT